MTTYQLRPMSIGEILDTGLTIYRRQFLTFLGIGVVGYGLSSVMLTYIALSGGFIEHFALTAFTYLVILPVGALLVSGAAVRVIADTFLGEQPSLDGALRYATGRMVPLLVAGSVTFILVIGAGILLIIPGLMLAFASSVVSQVVILERPESSVSALPRSWALTRDNRWRAFALTFVASLILFIPVTALGIIAAIWPTLEPAVQIVAELVRVSTYPILPTVLTLYYYDLRVRKEAFDLQVLSQQLGAATPA